MSAAFRKTGNLNLASKQNFSFIHPQHHVGTRCPAGIELLNARSYLRLKPPAIEKSTVPTMDQPAVIRTAKPLAAQAT